MACAPFLDWSADAHIRVNLLSNDDDMTFPDASLSSTHPADVGIRAPRAQQEPTEACLELADANPFTKGGARNVNAAHQVAVAEVFYVTRPH